MNKCLLQTIMKCTLQVVAHQMIAALAYIVTNDSQERSQDFREGGS